jgi:hypothetical protein
MLLLLGKELLRFQHGLQDSTPSIDKPVADLID